MYDISFTEQKKINKSNEIGFSALERKPFQISFGYSLPIAGDEAPLLSLNAPIHSAKISLVCFSCSRELNSSLSKQINVNANTVQGNLKAP